MKYTIGDYLALAGLVCWLGLLLTGIVLFGW